MGLTKFNLKMPVLVAPMFRVSGPDLVIESCKSGVIGSFPTINARTIDDLNDWYEKIKAELKEENQHYAANIVIRNKRLDEELEMVRKHQPPIVITSVGPPTRAIPVVREYGGLVFSDVASLYHAKKAAEAGVDGLILLTAGAGGNTGWNNPFAFISEVRKFYDGIIILAGGIMDGRSIVAAEVMGADLVYMGTKFIPTIESMAQDEYKQRLVDSDIDDIITTKAFTSLNANFIKSTIEEAGLDINNLPEFEDFENSIYRKARWKTIWSAGHGVGEIESIEKVSGVVEQLYEEYAQVKGRTTV